VQLAKFNVGLKAIWSKRWRTSKQRSAQTFCSNQRL